MKFFTPLFVFFIRRLAAFGIVAGLALGLLACGEGTATDNTVAPAPPPAALTSITEPPRSRPVEDIRLLSPSELRKIVEKDQGKPKLMDVRPLAEYLEGHIPGAVNVDISRLDGYTTEFGVGTLPAPHELAPLLSALGLNSDDEIVVYDEARRGGTESARLLWVLEVAGHNGKKLGVLNGGIAAYAAQGYPLTQEATTPPAGNYTVRLMRERVADFRDVLNVVNAKPTDKILLDVRSADEFTGRDLRSNPRGGHLPGAVNIDFLENLNLQSGALKDPEELRRLYESRGITRDKEVILYCQTGNRTSQTYLTLKVLGYPNVRVYDASFAEWSQMRQLPVTRRL